MRCTLLATALLALVPGVSSAQRAGITQLPDTVVAAIDRGFAWATAESPGCAIGVARQGTPVLTRAYGMANLEHGVPNTPETVFESGSVAKQFTAAAVMLLVGDGKLSLDDDIRRWLPEVPDFGAPITVRMLLTHTSGLRDQWGLLSLSGNGPGRQVHTFETILDLVSRQKALNFAPGTEYLYSNTGYVLAALVVQRASGKRFAQFSEERLFEPLGMTNTRWRDDFTRVVKQRATAYTGSSQVGFRQDMPFTNVHGNGGLLTTVGDLLLWNAFLDQPKAEVGGAALVAALETPGRLRGGRAIGYALGLGVDSIGGRRAISHSGATAGYRTWLARFPGEQLSVAVLCNAGGANPTALGTQVASRLLPPRTQPAAAQAGAPAPALSAAELGRYAGTFHAPRTGQVMRIDVRDGRLMAVQPSTVPLTPIASDRFRLGGVGEIVYRTTGARVTGAMLLQGDDTTTFVVPAPVDSSTAALARYAGTYHSAELDLEVAVAVKDGRLVLRQRPLQEHALRPAFRDAFEVPGAGTIIFTRDRAGRIDGLGVWAGRIRNVRFDRVR
ncbi:MAG TPA: serine hydrolase domain-containing protein [Gemmatimonadaceae bacterium]|nr:serine hydrolase domain-containing protein [Gemmatimonadaceae bacterium]